MIRKPVATLAVFSVALFLFPLVASTHVEIEADGAPENGVVRDDHLGRTSARTTARSRASSRRRCAVHDAELCRPGARRIHAA